MEVKPGYKQTEVGVIPEKWDVKALSDVGHIRTGPFGTALKAAEYYASEGAPLVSVRDIGEGVLTFDEHTPLVPPAVVRRLPEYILNAGDIVFGRKGGVERSAMVRDDQAGCFLGSDGIRIRPSKDCHAPFITYQFQRHEIQAWLLQNATGTTMASMNQGILRRVSLPFPSKSEQRAIATALSDVDGLLGELDRLIAKKRNLKQAAMQQLLTGQTRLPGFHGEWEVKRLAQIVDFANGKPHESHIEATGQCNLITLDSIGIDGKLKTEHKPIGLLDNSLQKGDIVTILSDIAHGNLLGLCDLIPEDNIYVLNQRVGRLRVKPETQANPQFLRLQINRRQHHFKTRGQGTSQRHIYRRHFDELELALPKPDEQTAIAEALTEMDAELAALEQRREKTRALKQAMMQELLTGRTRLVPAGGSDA